MTQSKFPKTRGFLLAIATALGTSLIAPLPAPAQDAEKDDPRLKDYYVANGSYEHVDRPELLQDRLYLNDGTGDFELAPEGSVPEDFLVASCVVAADVDRDGDLDLFVGSRTVPGAYPESPPSRLLLNREGTLVDATGTSAPGLKDAGMVTGATWADVDLDGWQDLLLAVDWGPIRVFMNREGILEEATGAAGLEERVGWWTGIASGDVDHDGDPDFLVTNFGRNNKYAVSSKKPAILYYGDFDGSGKPALVEAKFSGKTLYPVRGLSCSSSCMPFVRKQFPTFHDFASAELEEIYSAEKLAGAMRLEVNTVESGILINEEGRFRFEPLPLISQASPSFGGLLRDVNSDGRVDAIMVQNFYGPQRETPRMAGGVGLILLGRGDGSFQPTAPSQTNFLVTEDAKSLAVADFNLDGWLDFAVGRNNDRTLAFTQTEFRGPRPLKLELKGPPGNPTCVGTVVRLHLKDSLPQWAQVTAGEGYLSQSSAMLHFTLPTGSLPDRLEITWPDGSRSTKPIHSRNRHLRIVWEDGGSPD